jgi:TP901 family phage tail tape measure protein
MNEQLIHEIKVAIQHLEEQKRKLDSLSQSTKSVDRDISVLTRNLNELAGSASLVGRTMAQAEASLNRLLSAARSGQNIRVRVGNGERVSSGGLFKAGFSDNSVNAAALTAVTTSNPNVVSGGAVNLSHNGGVLTKEEQARVKKANAEQVKILRRYIREVEKENRRIAHETEQKRKEGESAMDAFDSTATKADEKRSRASTKLGETKTRVKADWERLMREQEQIDAQANAQRIREEAIRNSARNPADYLHNLNPSGRDTTINDLRSSLPGADNDTERERLIREQKQIEDESNRVMQERIRIQQRKLSEAKRVNSRLNLADSLPGGKVAADRLFAQAQKVDPAYTPDKIKSVYTEPSSGISKVNYEMKTAEGIFKRTTFTVDKFGNVLVDTQRRFRSFGDAIARDIGEFAKWSIAAALVLGPLQKLGELTQVMIKNQATLADVTIALGDAQESTAAVFEASARIAEDTGESLDGVLEAYNLAYRATGGAADGTERFATANVLLTDAITLSKLSTLDQAEAIDVLSAALKQSNVGLDEGEKFINKWIAVTKVANVDLTTLATGFAVLGDAADSAGLGIDELNTVIALVAESSGQSATEVANTARALIGGVQTDAASEQIKDLGISLTKSSGDAKNFLEIIREINELRGQGIVDPEAFKKLTAVLGGGVRRQAAVSTFINSYRDQDKINEIMGASTNATEATGEAQDALAVKLQLVETSVINLGNAFQTLAQALGDEGGVLGIFTSVLDTLTGITKGVADLTQVMGKSGPILATTLAGLAFLKHGSRGSIMASELGGMAQNLAGGFMMRNQRTVQGVGDFYNPYGNSLISKGDVYSRANSVGNFVGKNAGKIAGYGLAALPAISTLAEEGLSGESVEKAGVQLGSAVIGTIIAGGNPVGALIGSAIGEALVNTMRNFKPELSTFFDPIFDKPVSEEKPKTKAEQEADLMEYLRNITFSPGILAPVKQAVLNIAGSTFGGENFKEVNALQSLLIDLELKKKNGTVDTAEYDKAMEMLSKYLAPVAEERKKEEETKNEYQPIIDQAVKAEQSVLLDKLINREVGIANYRGANEQLGLNFGSKSSQYYNAFGKDYGGTPDVFFRDMARIVGEAKPEEVDVLTKFKEDINTETDQQKKNELIKQAIAYTHELNTTYLAQVNILKDLDFSEYTIDEFKKIENEGWAFFEEFMAKSIALGELTNEQAEAYRKTLEDSIVLLESGYDVVTKLPSNFLKLGENKAGLNKNKDLGFSALDITTEQYNAATSPEKYKQIRDELQALGYQEKMDDSLINILKDGNLIEHRDQKIVQFLLSKIEENTSELDGAYNLPDGASFWIPYQAAKLMQNQGGSGSSSTNPTNPTTPQTPASNWTQANQADADRWQAQADYYKQLAEKKEKTYIPTVMKESEVNPIGEEHYGPPAGYPQWTDSGKQDNFLDTFLKGAGALFAPMMEMLQNGFIGKTSDFTSKGLDMAQLTQSLSNISTKLNLTIENKTVVTLDGRQIAMVVKQYLKNDLVKYTGGASSKTATII